MMNSNERILAVASTLVDEVQSIEGGERYIYTGSSMFPFLQERDALIVKAISPYNLKIGGIIVYQRNGRYIIHRFLGWNRRKYPMPRLRAKGDNAPLFDKSIEIAEFIGQAVSIKRNNRYINLESKSAVLLNFFIGIFSIIQGLIRCLIPRKQ